MERSLDTAAIAILCPGYGVVARGVETSIAEMMPRLLDLRPGWTFDVYCRASGGVRQDGVRLVHIPAIDRDGWLAATYARTAHRLRIFLRTRIDAECLSFTVAAAPSLLRARYDLIFNQAGPFAGGLLQLKRVLDGTPFVHETASGFGALESIMARQHPDRIIATSPYVLNWLEEHVSDARVDCIPKAVDDVTFRPYSREELVTIGNGSGVLRLKHPVVLFVGAMDPMKRPELVVSAVRRLPDASLVMVGDGILAESIRAQGMQELGPGRFLHVSRVSRDQMPLYYNACDVLALPSEEPFGMVFLEAMACGRPAIAHHSPVQEWILGDAGRTCDCTNPAEFAATIRSVLQSDCATQARQRSTEFGWGRIARQYEEVFTEVMLSRRGHGGRR